jgi:hypothetical protein
MKKQCNHVWRNDYINGGKVCQVCMKKKTDDTIEETGKRTEGNDISRAGANQQV